MTLVRRLPPLGSALSAAAPPRLPGEAGRTRARRLRIAARVAGAVLVTLPTGLLQALLLPLPGAAKRVVPRLYWAAICRVLGVERRVLGTQLRHGGRPVLFVSNHTSWLDIPTLGGTLRACFVSKAEVARWPGINLIAHLGRTVFVSRRAGDTGRERDSMLARLRTGDNLLLFPEGTSSDGARTLPFRSPFFALAAAVEGGPAPLIQPVSIVYDRLDGLPALRFGRPVTSWYGAMELGRHFARLAQVRRVRATVVLHEPIDPACFASRKLLARAVWEVVATGAARLRQNRPPL